jgi:hypothetical protein
MLTNCPAGVQPLDRRNVANLHPRHFGGDQRVPIDDRVGADCSSVLPGLRPRLVGQGQRRGRDDTGYCRCMDARVEVFIQFLLIHGPNLAQPRSAGLSQGSPHFWGPAQ